MHPDEEKARIKKSLRYSIFDGSFYSIMAGFGESFFTPFAIFLKANNMELGILSALPQFLGSVLQIASKKLMNIFKSRKKFSYLAAFFHALTIIPIALSVFMGNLSIYWLIFFVCMYWIIAMSAGPAWSSWMADLVPESERGKYFGNRSRIVGFVLLISLLGAGIVMEYFKGTGRIVIGFMALFGIATIARLISFLFLTREYEPEYTQVPGDTLPLKHFVQNMRSNNFGIYVIYMALTNFAIFIAAPFFTAYMLNDLKLSYVTFTGVTIVSLLVKNISLPFWGKAADEFGARKTLALASLLIPITSLMWIFLSPSPNVVIYLAIIHAVSGFLAAGFELSTFNFLLDATSPGIRQLQVSYNSFFSGIAVLFGGIAGGFLVNNHVFSSNYFLVFLSAGVLRYFAAALLLPKLNEVREVRTISYPKLLRLVARDMPVEGVLYHIISFNSTLVRTTKTGLSKIDEYVHISELGKMMKKKE